MSPSPISWWSAAIVLTRALCVQATVRGLSTHGRTLRSLDTPALGPTYHALRLGRSQFTLAPEPSADSSLSYAYPVTANGTTVPPNLLQLADPQGMNYWESLQGYAPDCVTAAMLASIAVNHTEALTALAQPAQTTDGAAAFDDNGYPLLNVTLNSPSGGSWSVVTDLQFPAGASFYGRDSMGEDEKVNYGMPLLEKAAVYYNDYFKDIDAVTPTDSGYVAYGGNCEACVYQALTNRSVAEWPTAQLSVEAFAASLQFSDLNFVGSPANFSNTLFPSGASLQVNSDGTANYTGGGYNQLMVNNHAYAIVGVRDGSVNFYNPWGVPLSMSYGDFTMVFTAILQSAEPVQKAPSPMVKLSGAGADAAQRVAAATAPGTVSLMDFTTACRWTSTMRPQGAGDVDLYLRSFQNGLVFRGMLSFLNSGQSAPEAQQAWYQFIQPAYAAPPPAPNVIINTTITLTSGAGPAAVFTTARSAGAFALGGLLAIYL